MPIADEQLVRATIGKYESVLFNAFHEGWNDWRALPLSGRLKFPARSRACLVYDFIVQRAMNVLAADTSVHVIERDETVKFVFGGVVALRFKKANDSGLGSNIKTQATLGFVDQQQELPGVPGVHKVEMVYTLNGLQTKIDQVLVAARDGDVCLWNYPIVPDSAAAVVPLPMPLPSDGGRGARVKLRVVEEGKKHGSGEK